MGTSRFGRAISLVSFRAWYKVVLLADARPLLVADFSPVGRVGDELGSEFGVARVTRLLSFQGTAWPLVIIDLSYPVDPVHPVSDFS